MVFVVQTAQPHEQIFSVYVLWLFSGPLGQLQYLLQVCDGLLQILGLLVFLLPYHVLLLSVQETDDVGNFGVLVHVEGQVVKGGNGLTFTGCETGHKDNKHLTHQNLFFFTLICGETTLNYTCRHELIGLCFVQFLIKGEEQICPPQVVRR